MLKNIPKQVILLGLISLFTDMASEMLYPITPIFLSGVLGASMAAIGIIEGVAEVSSGLLKGYFGFLSDKLGKRSIFVSLGYGISALSKPLPGIFPHFSTVLTSRITDRIGKGVRTAPRDALLGSYSNDNSGAIFGFHRSMDTIGAVLGPLAAIWLLSKYNNNFQLIYLIAFIPSLCAVIITLFVKDKEVRKKNTSKHLSFQFWQQAPSNYKRLLILVTIFSLVNSSDVFLILKIKNISGNNTTAILAYVFYNLIYALSSYPAGIISDKMGKKTIFVSGLVLFSLVYLGFGLMQDASLIWLLFAVYGIYAAATEGILKAWISDMVQDNQRGSAVGLLTMMMSFGVMGGSVLAGFLWDQFGASMPFLLSSLVSLIIALLLLIVVKTEQNSLPNNKKQSYV